MSSPPHSVLSDQSIKRLVEAGRIVITPWDPARVQPASVDVLLGDSFRVFHNHRVSAIDLRDPPANLTEEVKLAEGEPFVIHPGEFCLGRTLEWVELPDDIVSRVEGKALAVTTEVPTPEGWRTMGDLRVGDLVYDRRGHPTPVLAASDVLVGRECRQVVFSDGAKAVADLDHQWQVWTRYDRRIRRPRVVTTGELERALEAERGKEYPFHVDQALPVNYPTKDLPVEPYTFGAWIGDGTSSQAESTTQDPEILGEIEGAGYPTWPASGVMAHRIGGTGGTRSTVTGQYEGDGSLNTVLRRMGVLGHKRMPRDYLEASVEQRRALLQGLMDTDGYVDVMGRCDITTVSRTLAADYHELIASLGYKPVIAEKAATLYGKFCGMRYEVTFTPHEDVFRLPRKVARQKLIKPFFKFGRAVVAVKPWESQPVRCIEVAAADGVFLITRAFVPTHNSSLGRLGLIVHATAGFVDPGWKGTLTLELNNLTRVPIKLYAGQPIAQLSFMALDRPAERPYGSSGLGSHYQGQIAATESRYGV